MFCKDCGAQLADGARFCPHCGSAQTVTPPAETLSPATESDFAAKVRTTAKKAGSSTAFLIAAICLTFAQVLGLVTPASRGFDTYFDIFYAFGADGLGIPSPSESLYMAASIISMLPGILIALGLWITFFTCVSRKNTVKTSGLTVIFVVNLVQMTLSCLVLLAALIPLAAAYTGADALADALFLADEDIIETIALAAGLVLLAVFVFALIYYIKLCTTISNIRSTLKTGVPNKKVSRFIAVLCYISGGILILSGISSLLSAGVVTLDSYYDATLTYAPPSEIFLSAVTSLLTATAEIIFGALLFTYRRKMAALEAEDRITTFQTLSHAEPYTSPVYIPPEPAEVIAKPVPAPEEIDETKRWDL